MIAYTVYSRDGRVRRCANAFAGRGDQVDVICLKEEWPSRDDNVNLIGLPLARYRGNSHYRYLGSYLTFFWRATARAVRRSRRHRYDVAIVCTMPDAAILSALPLRAFGSKLVLDIHDTMPELYRDKFAGWHGATGARMLMFGERACARLADRVLAVHELHAERLISVGIPAAKLRVVLNSPDPRIFKRYPSVPRGGDDFNLVCHGTVTRRLGLDVALHAIAILRQRLAASPHLTIIGEGDYLGPIRALAESLGIQSQVTFRQSMPVEALPAALASATIGLVPNLGSAATHLMLPVKLLEYATLGIPIISARLRAVEHYFGDDALEYFEPGDPVELAEAIERLRRSPGRRAALADRACQIAVRLGWESQRVHLFEAIDSILGAGVSGSSPLSHEEPYEEGSRSSPRF